MRIFVLLGLLCSFVGQASGNPWLSLVPELERTSQVFQVNHQQSLDQQAEQNTQGTMVQALHGQNMRMPGFVVPLETNGDKITEFFLVPFFGACLHFPPPPPNQIIHVKHAAGIDMVEPWQVVWIEGELLVQHAQIEGVASAGYAMNLKKDIEFYAP
ncbi:DUF3299 domain-containing protein [Agarivorans sp. MS3-6]